MNGKRYKPKGHLYFKPHIFNEGDVGLYIWLLFAVGTLFHIPPLKYDYRISDGMQLILIFVGAFVLLVGYIALRIGYYYFKKRFFKPKPEEDEKPLFKRIEMPEWLKWIVSTVLFFLVLWLVVYFLVVLGFIG